MFDNYNISISNSTVSIDDSTSVNVSVDGVSDSSAKSNKVTSLINKIIVPILTVCISICSNFNLFEGYISSDVKTVKTIKFETGIYIPDTRSDSEHEFNMILSLPADGDLTNGIGFTGDTNGKTVMIIPDGNGCLITKTNP